MKFYSETIAFFREHFPSFSLDYQPLIWDKVNVGIIKKPGTTPRNVTETALVLTRNRTLRQPRNNCFSHNPQGKSALAHASEKSTAMLEYYTAMFIDEFTRVLDPTVGGGTLFKAATTHKALEVYGLEIDKDTWADGRNNIMNEVNLV